MSAVAFILAVGGASLAPQSALAQTVIGAPAGAVVSDIAILGNQRIERATILSYMTVAQGSSATAADINESVKALYDTGLFKDVRIDPRGSQLVVTVQENPVVNQIAFEGNDAIADDLLAGGVISRERRVFTRAKAESDAETILEAYRRSGRYAATVEPKIIELPQNRVDLVFEIEEGPSTGVDSIRFVGNTVFSDRRLRGVISTDESTWLNFLSATDSYDPDRLEYDKELLRRWYLANGYIDFEVETAFAELSPDQSGFLITFTLIEGEQYRYGPVTVISNTEGVDGEELQQLVTMDEGSIYSIDEVEETIQAIRERLGEQGYAFTEIEPLPERNPETRTLGVVLEVNEGPRVFVERIDIDGNVRTLDRVIRREFEIVEGDAFDALQLRRSRANIRGLGFFSSVDVKTEPGSQPDRVIVTTEVEEQSTGQLSFGVGFSTSESVSGEVSIVERNLLGRGQFLRARAKVSGSTTLYDLSFTEPAFLGRDVAAGFDLYRRETDNQDTSSFDLINTGFRPRVSFPLGKYTRITPRYRISQDEVVDVPANASPLIRADIGETLTSAIGYELVHDRRNDPVTPSQGYILKLEQDIAGAGGDSEYFSTEASAKIYRALYGEDVIGSFELAGGGIASFGDYNLKASDRYYLGGDSFRGFESAGLGPRDQFTGDTLGGNIYAIARTEVSFPLGLPEEYGLAGGVFADVGTLFRLDQDSYIDGTGVINGGAPVTIDDEMEFRASVGATVFWSSPFGPIKLNFATPILKQDGDEEEFFRFSAGTRF